MPVSRKKSCRNCRRAKARCNLSFPCSRCTERDLQCIFEEIPRRTPQSSHSGAQGIRSDAEDLSSSGTVQGNAQQAFTDFIDATMDEVRGSGLEQGLEFTVNDGQDPGIPLVHDAASDAAFDWNVAGRLFSGSSSLDFFNTSPRGPSLNPEQPSQSNLSSKPGRLIDYLQVRSLSPQQAGNNHQAGFPVPRQSTSLLEIERGVAFIYRTVYSNLLAPKKPKSKQSFLMRQVIWGQIRDYPKMIIDGSLPPFIYPPCVLNDKLPRVCTANGMHDCLPEPLAICSSLVRMFYSRTGSTSAFVWRSIYAELDRLRAEVSYYLMP